MSTDHATPDADAGADHDPYDIVPDGFVEAWDAETIPEALDKAEAAPSTTDPREQRRCSNCLAARLTPLSDRHSAHSWECTECHARIDAALPPLTDAARTAGHTPESGRESTHPRCRGCLSTDLYPVPESAPLDVRWACLDCGERFDDALPSRAAVVRGDVTPAEKAAIGEAYAETVTWDGVRKTNVRPVGETESTTLEEVFDG
ncbi:MAG: hypothetical protein HQRvContig02_49 [Haloquadratum phage sp.]|nr:MAG: hypothetical protein HQRvContig02_49 [Haloquadratum phage sp.]